MFEFLKRIKTLLAYIFQEKLTSPSLAETRTKAEQGHAVAQFNLGNMYREGDGVPQDDAEAVKRYRKAAEQGLTEAQGRVLA